MTASSPRSASPRSASPPPASAPGWRHRVGGWLAAVLLALVPLGAVAQRALPPAPPGFDPAATPAHGAADVLRAIGAGDEATRGAALDRVALILYSHGVTFEPDPETAGCWADPPELPAALTALDRTELNGLTLRLVGYCYHARTGLFFTPTGQGITRLSLRNREIVAVLAALEAAGLARSRIVLAGHSLGAWGKLLILAEDPGAARAVIGLSPACCGPAHLRAGRPGAALTWANDARRMAAAARLPALIYLVERDAYTPLADFAFIAGVPGVTYRPWPTAALGAAACAPETDPHLAALEPCFAGREGASIRAYLAATLR